MNTKKLAAGCMAVLMLTGSVLGIPVARVQGSTAWQVPRNDHNDHNHMIQMPFLDMQAEFYKSDMLTDTSRILPKSAKTSDNLSDSVWAACGGSYYYSLLSTKEKKLYLNLKNNANSLLTGTDNFQTTKVIRDGQEVNVYILPMVSYKGLAAAQMKKVYYCFMYENPQYYFMRNSVIYSEKTEMMTIGLYENFANGSKRRKYTDELAQQLDSWQQEISKAGTVVEKEQLIHQIICGHVDYNADYNEAETGGADDRSMSQSCISAVLFDRLTVCTGYAQLFTLLCSCSGIDCVTVTSAGHAWNKVWIGDIWYNVDCTWDDSRGDTAYLNVTDQQLQAEDTALAEHTLSEEWQGLAPACTVEFEMTKAADSPGSAFIQAPEKVEGITVQSREKGKMTVSFQPAAGCDGYIIQYALTSSMSSAKKKEIEKTSCTITGLKSGKTYYIRTRAYVLDSNGNKLYGAYSKKQKAAVK